MFSPEITSSDRFLDMGVSARELYFQLGMNADDDGFVTPKKIMRMTGCSEDDLKVLIAKKFVIPFPSGVVVITDWKINNLVRKDWYKETFYKEEKAQLQQDINNRYQFVNEPSTQVRLGKVRLGKDIDIYFKQEKTNEESAYKKNNNLPLQEIVDHFNTTFNRKTTSLIGFEKNANIWLKEYSVEQIKEAITNWYYDLRSGKPRFFANDPSLVLLFRTKNRGGECDYIGDLLNIKVNKSKMIERDGVLYLSDRDFK